jgi:glucokinase-like ROK family protein
MPQQSDSLRQSRYRTGDQALVRQMNLAVIMHHLRESAPVSRAALAEMTGLNKTTVSSLVQELIRQRFVEEYGFNSAGAGRPAVLLRLNPAAGCIVAAEVGVGFLSVIRTNFAAEIVWHYKENISREMGQQAIVDRLLALLSLATSAGCETLLGLAVGVPGLVDESTSTLLFAPNLGWHDVPLGALLRTRFTAPTFVDNEANLAALGEHYFGAAKGHDEVVYVSAGVGLGGGILRDGRLCRGAAGFSGEFGHMTIDPQGELCNCGNRGCWETVASQSALFRLIRKTIAGGHPGRLPAMTDGDLDRLAMPVIVEAAQAGDAVVLDALKQVGRYLGIGIASLVNALNPELVVFGGPLSLADRFLRPVIEAELANRALRWSISCVQVVPAKHGSDACVMGGVAAVLQSVLTQPGSGPFSRQVSLPLPL